MFLYWVSSSVRLHSLSDEVELATSSCNIPSMALLVFDQASSLIDHCLIAAAPGVGHSMGSLMHLLMGTAEPGATRANVLMSFNNKYVAYLLHL